MNVALRNQTGVARDCSTQKLLFRQALSRNPAVRFGEHTRPRVFRPAPSPVGPDAWPATGRWGLRTRRSVPRGRGTRHALARALPFPTALFRLRSPTVAAFSLIECLVYMAVFFVVLGVAFAAYYRMDEQARGFTRNSAGIIRAMQAGERWRADVRAMTNAVQISENQGLQLTASDGNVSYFFRDGAVWRQGAKEKHATPVLQNVKASTMKLDGRKQVRAWKWEIELQTKRTNVTVRPLFTFLAVPATEGAR